jgi:hypothetical protein
MVQLDPAGHTVLWRADTDQCPNGSTIDADRTGTRLMLATNPACGRLSDTADVVQVWEGPQFHDIGRYVNPDQFVSGVAWR